MAGPSNSSSSSSTPAAEAQGPAPMDSPTAEMPDHAANPAGDKTDGEAKGQEPDQKDQPPTPEEFVEWACKVDTLKDIPKACKSVFIQHCRTMWANELAPTQDASPTQVGTCVLAMLQVCKTALVKPKRGGRRGAKFRARVRRRIAKTTTLRQQRQQRLSQQGDSDESSSDYLPAHLQSKASKTSKTTKAYKHRHGAAITSRRSQLKKSIARAKSILRAGNSQFGNNTKRISRAVAALNRAGTLVLDDATFEKLEKLHPKPSADGEKIPDLPSEAECGPRDLGDERLIHKTLQGLASGAASGASGWTAELMLVLWEDQKCREAITNVIAHLANGNIDKESGDILRASLVLPFQKPEDPEGVRPIAMGEVIYKCVGAYMMTKHKDLVKEALPGIQLGVGADGGPEVAVHVILNALRKKHPGLYNILISDDLPNAYNERSRARILQILFSNKKLKPFFRFAHWAYGTPSALFTVSRGKIVWKGFSMEGVKQGDPIATFLFALSVQATFEEAHKFENVTAVAICDDLEIVGPIESAFQAYEAVAEAQLKEGMNRITNKRFVLWIHNREPPERLRELCDQHGLKLVAGAEEDDDAIMEPQWVGGSAKVLGCMISANEKTTEEWVCEKVLKHLPFFRAVAHEDMPAQHAVTLLRAAGLPRMNYLTRTTPHEVVKKGAQMFDELVLATLVKTCEIRLEEEENGELTPESKEAIDQIARPTRHAGLGFRRTADTASAAFLAAAMQARLANPQDETDKDSQYLIDREAAHHAIVKRMFDAIVEGMAPAYKRDTFSEAEKGKLTEAAIKQLNISLDGLGLSMSGKAAQFCKDVDEMWTAKKMQKKLVQKCELLEYRAKHQYADKTTRARLLSLSAQGSSAWTLTPAFEASHLMSTPEYRRAIHYALNLHQLDSNTILCPMCGKDNTPQHPLNCHKTRSMARTAMHDNLEIAVTRDFHDELMWHTLRQPKATRTGNFTDLRVYRPLARGQKNSVYEIDFVTVDPTCDTHVKSAQKEGGAALDAEQRKISKHAPRLAASGIGFTPFGIETYGAVGKGANAIMKTLARNLSEMWPELYDLDRLQQHIRTKISVARARGLAMGLTAHLSQCLNVLEKDLHGHKLRDAKHEHFPSSLFIGYCQEQDNADDKDQENDNQEYNKQKQQTGISNQDTCNLITPLLEAALNSNELAQMQNPTDFEDVDLTSQQHFVEQQQNNTQDSIDTQTLFMTSPPATPPMDAVAHKTPVEHMNGTDNTQAPATTNDSVNADTSLLTSSPLNLGASGSSTDLNKSQPAQNRVSITNMPQCLGEIAMGKSVAKQFLSQHTGLELQHTLGDGNCGPLACLHSATAMNLWDKTSKNPTSAKGIRNAVVDFVEEDANEEQLAKIFGVHKKRTRSQMCLKARAADWAKSFGRDLRHDKVHVAGCFMRAFTIMMGVGCRFTETLRDPADKGKMIATRDGATICEDEEPEVILEFVLCQGKKTSHWTWAK
jgi:hypothetical protein